MAAFPEIMHRPSATVKAAPFGVSEISGILALLVNDCWLLITLRHSHNLLYLIQTLLFFGWLLVSILLLKYWTLFWENLYSHNVAIDVPWFASTKRLIDGSYLSGKERFIVWIAAFIHPPITGIITTFVWHNASPMKARQANLIALVAFMVYAAYGLTVALLH